MACHLSGYGKRWFFEKHTSSFMALDFRVTQMASDVKEILLSERTHLNFESNNTFYRFSSFK